MPPKRAKGGKKVVHFWQMLLIMIMLALYSKTQKFTMRQR